MAPVPHPVVGPPALCRAGAGKPALVVLPFDGPGDNAQQDYFAEGLTDDLITDLSKISGLMVIARHSAFAFKDQPGDVRHDRRAIGRPLCARRQRPPCGRHHPGQCAARSMPPPRSNIWAERYDGSATKIFELQDELIRRVVEALSVRLTESETSAITRLPTRNLEAYDFYMRAEQKVYSIGQRPWEKPSRCTRRRSPSIPGSPTPMRAMRERSSMFSPSTSSP